ncbi:MAG: hypothetical protein IPK78_19515 [Rhodospirillales bacterium]|nr:hypothetical protein [Rhodospirillales bacterium]
MFAAMPTGSSTPPHKRLSGARTRGTPASLRGAVQKARSFGAARAASGRLGRCVHFDARRAQATDPSKQRSHTPPARHGFRPVPEAAVAAVGETLKEQGLTAPQASGMTFLQARTANEVLKARLRRMEVQQKEGDLVDRARAVALVFRLARQERDGSAFVKRPVVNSRNRALDRRRRSPADEPARWFRSRARASRTSTSA